MDAATPLFLRELMPGLIKACSDREVLLAITNLIYNDPLFALNPVMATCKAITAAGSDVSHSSVVTVMARNGTEFGIKVSGLGDRWFTGLAAVGQGSLMPGCLLRRQSRYGRQCDYRDLGLGGTVKFRSGSSQDATDTTLQLYGVTQGK